MIDPLWEFTFSQGIETFSRRRMLFYGRYPSELRFLAYYSLLRN